MDRLNERLAGVVTQGDAAWFAAHPDNRLRMRNAVPGEFNEKIGAAPVGMSWRCIVVEAQPGVRMRLPVALPISTTNDGMNDQELFALFIQAAPAEARKVLDEFRGLNLRGIEVR